MGGKPNRTRRHQVLVRLTEDEYTMLMRQVKRSGLSREEYLRSLINKKKGRPPRMKKENDNTARSADEVNGESADKARIKLLEKKNKELEAEVAYLKKLNALVQERKKRESKKK